MIQGACGDVSNEAGTRRLLAGCGMVDDLKTGIVQTQNQWRGVKIIPHGNRDIEAVICHERKMNLSLLGHRLVYRALTRSRPTTRVGDGAAWNLALDSLSAESFVISGGAGHDISFELELVARTGCRLVLLDPSPTGKATVDRTDLPSELVFEGKALSSQVGALSLARPLDMREGSWRLDVNGLGEEMQSTSIVDIMQRFAVDRVDLLKIDIEGFEYDVLNDVLQRGIPIQQICVEIHEGPIFGKRRSDRWNLIFQLFRAGYQLIHNEGWDHTFLHKGMRAA